MVNSKRHLLRIIIPAFPSFNIYSKIAKRTTALGPILVATSANKLLGWDVEVIDENNCRDKLCPKDELGRPNHLKLQQERPADVVGFYGSLTSTIPRLYELASLYKSFGSQTIAGGKHIESLPEEALNNNVDVVIFGDGEETIREILLVWQNKTSFKKIAGIAFRQKSKLMNIGAPRVCSSETFGSRYSKTKSRQLIIDFEKLPFPDFGLLRYAKMKTYPVSWWRGCPHNCEFCAVKDKTRCASAERFTRLIAYLVETRKAKSFFIVDDHFGGNHYNKEQLQETLRLCQMLAEYQKKIGKRLSFSAQIRLTAANHPELLQAMRQAGFSTVFIGYESPIDEELTSMRKGYLSDQMIKWTRVFHSFGFFIHGMFIFGYPYKKGGLKERINLPLAAKTKRFKQFISRAKIDTVQILLTVPLPGTELRHRLEQEGRIYPLNQISWEYYDGQFPLFKPDDGVSPEELQGAVKEIMSGFYGFRHFWKIVLGIIFHFPRLVFPATLTLVSLRVRYLTAVFRKWRRRYFRNQAYCFGGYLIVKSWLKKFRQDNFLEKLSRAKQQLAEKLV